MVDTTESDAIAVLRECYGIKGGGLQRVAGGGFSPVFAVADDERRLFLKRQADEHDANYAAWFDTALKTVRDGGIDAPLLPNVNGHHLSGHRGSWTLARHVDGKPLALGDRSQLAQALDVVRRITSLRSAPSEVAANPKGDLSTWYTDPAQARRRFETVCAAAENVVAPDVIARVVRVVEMLLPELTTESYAALPTALSHGELQNTNLLVASNGAMTLIDWDSFGVRPRLFDIATALAFLTRRERGSFLIDRTWFNEGLASFAPTVDEQRQCVPLALLFLLPAPYSFHKYQADASARLGWYLNWCFTSIDQAAASLGSGQ